jgi:protein TonB
VSEPTDIFTVDEIARAAGVPRPVVEQLVESGRIRPIGSSALFRAADAVRAGRLAREMAAATVQIDAAATPSILAPSLAEPARSPRHERRLSALVSSAAHVALGSFVVWATTGAAQTAPVAIIPKTRLVFLAGPGPGGGGGGGGRAPRAETPRIARPRPARSEQAVAEPPPLPSRTLVSAVAATSGDNHQEAEEVDGSGPGVGPGTDDGSGGGAGGGPYRPGSGIDPPRLLREVKAQYTEDARRRRVTGSVVLEIVILKDGAVGDVKVLRGLGFGLDEKAASAVRNWRFAPARRLGEPVDVIVEVEVDFSLR